MQGKLDVLARHCDDVGRDPSTIQTTILGGPDPLADTDAFLAEMERYAALGVDLVQVGVPTQDPVGFVAHLGDHVIPRLADISA